ncbi:MAG: hypothetical protein GX566_06095 [Bacteroidales bacterium]|nr:hypothetical protein [Bacteroidales bacterium]
MAQVPIIGQNSRDCVSTARAIPSIVSPGMILCKNHPKNKEDNVLTRIIRIADVPVFF